jgi:hypothetical protein
MISSNFGAQAMAHFERREIRRALAYFEKALEAGEDPYVHTAQRWQCWMLLGEFANAWKESDLSGASFQPGILETKHVLIRCLRGFGDGIQFLRYVPMLERQVETITVQAPRRLLPLLRRAKGIDQAIDLESDMESLLPGASEIECSDLPYLFRTTPATIPPETAFRLPVCLDRSDRALRVGVAWTAGIWNPIRSFPPELLSHWSRIQGLRFISLQRGPDGDSLDPVLPHGFVPGEAAGSTILDTARVVSQLDLVISVDSMPAHLAASLGTPVWLLLHHGSDWRWMLDREDSPWYRSMRIYRQPYPGDWLQVAHKIAAGLQELRSPDNGNMTGRPRL